MAQDREQLVLRIFDRIRDYPEYASWWAVNDDAAPELMDLPVHGYSVYKANRLVSCGFMALTDVDWGIFCFWFCNPDNIPRESHLALRMIVCACQLSIKKMGRNKIFAYTSHRGMIKLLEGCNFFNVDGHLKWAAFND